MANKKTTNDVVLEATMARSAWTKFTHEREPSAKAKKAHEALQKAMAEAAETLRAKREALQQSFLEVESVAVRRKG